VPPLVGIGLTELPNSGGAKAPPVPLLTTAMLLARIIVQTPSLPYFLKYVDMRNLK